MQMRQRDVAALDAKYTKELADAKAENDALRDDVAAGRRFTNVCWVSVLTTFSAPPQILAASTVFFCPIPETKK